MYFMAIILLCNNVRAFSFVEFLFSWKVNKKYSHLADCFLKYRTRHVVFPCILMHFSKWLNTSFCNCWEISWMERVNYGHYLRLSDTSRNKWHIRMSFIDVNDRIIVICSVTCNQSNWILAAVNTMISMLSSSTQVILVAVKWFDVIVFR